jgi:hypothetical protein
MATQVKQLSSLEGCSGVVDVIEQCLKAQADRMGGFAAKRFKGFVLTQLSFGCEF